MADTVSYTYHPSTIPWFPAGVVRSTDEAWVPCDLGNVDYQAFLAWMAEGNPAPSGWTGPTNVTPSTG